MNAAQSLALLEQAETHQIDVTFIARGRIRLLSPVRVILDGLRITVPRGFECDGASVPAIFWPVISHPLSGSSLRAAIVHDWLCRRPMSVNRTMSSRTACRIFAQLLAVDGVAPVRRWCMVQAVRWFGPRF